MLKGLAITPPILGRITIGKLVENNGKRLPQKDDQFTITSQLQTKEGWIRHPFDEQLRSAQEGKLRQIPIRLLFNDPDLNLRAEYALFDRQTARPLCVGDGEQCKRRTRDGMETLPCPSPDGCPLAQGGACKPYGRLNVLIGDDDPLGSFIFRTTGFNSIRTLAARLAYFKAWSYAFEVNPPAKAGARRSSTWISPCVKAGRWKKPWPKPNAWMIGTNKPALTKKPSTVRPRPGLPTGRLKTVPRNPSTWWKSSIPMPPSTHRAGRHPMPRSRWPTSCRPKTSSNLKRTPTPRHPPERRTPRKAVTLNSP